VGLQRSGFDFNLTDYKNIQGVVLQILLNMFSLDFQYNSI